MKESLLTMALNYHMLSFITKCVQEWALGGYYTVDYYIIFSTTYIGVLAFLMVYMHITSRVCSCGMFSEVSAGLGVESSCRDQK